MRPLVLFVCCLVLSSCGFSHLTDIKNQDTSAPTAKECGECHVEQYAEWQTTRHAAAYVSDAFKQQSDHYTDTDCLFCHTPGDVQDPDGEPREYNREEGITCVSCHLHEGSMQGPHESSALVSPHAVNQNKSFNSKLDVSKLCGVCHEETYEQWLLQQEDTTVKSPACTGCHGAPVTRTPTKGTNFFSNILVSFEDEHEVRSHQLMVFDQVDPTSSPQVRLIADQQNSISITISNTLPHDLPTGSFGEKSITVTAHRLRDSTVLATASISLPTTLAPGQSVTLSLPLTGFKQSDQLQITLLRRHDSMETATLIRTYYFPKDNDVHTL